MKKKKYKCLNCGKEMDYQFDQCKHCRTLVDGVPEEELKRILEGK